MGALRDEGRVHLLGVSNVTAGRLAELCEGARHRPDFCQNRCFAAQGWDADAAPLRLPHPTVPLEAGESLDLLVFTRTEGFRHSAIENGVVMLEVIAAEEGDAGVALRRSY